VDFKAHEGSSAMQKLACLVVGGAVVSGSRKAKSTATHKKAAGARAQRVKVCRRAVAEIAAEEAQKVDFKKLKDYSLGELEELYIDSLWSYYREGETVLTDKEFDDLKRHLYSCDSSFPTLRASEVAFVEASIANIRNDPVVSDAEFKKLAMEIQESGRRKDITAFLLFERGERLLSAEQYAEMKDEVEKLGMVPVNMDTCNLAQLEEMYIDALWAYHNDKKQILSDEQYDKLQQELSWQGSGFPCLRKEEVNFVKASLAYWRGSPIVNDEEWKDIKEKVAGNERSKEISAFLLFCKGKQELTEKQFAEMSEEMKKLGVNVRKVNSGADREIFLSDSGWKVEVDGGGVAYMLIALSAAPFIITCAVSLLVGLLAGFKDPTVFLSGGLIVGSVLSYALLGFLDLKNPQILTCTCPACGEKVTTFAGGEAAPDMAETSCQACGTPIAIDVKARRIAKAGIGARISSDNSDQMEWTEAWVAIKDAVMEKSPEFKKLGQIDPKTTFAIWDKDGSGAITIDEMRSAFNALNLDIPNKDLESLFRDADKNDDGYVDYEEFHDMWIAAGQAGQGPVSKEFEKKSMSKLFRE